MGTLKDILGDGDGIQASAKDKQGQTTIVTQFLNGGMFNWTYHDLGCKNYAHYKTDFEDLTMDLDPDAEEPIWTRVA